MTLLTRSAIFICCWMIWFCPALNAQIIDNFSDGDFSTNPAWQGETNEFKVNAAGELQLNAPDAGSSLLAVQGHIPDSAVWLLEIRMEFAPSSTNLLRVYLLADQADLPNANGYFLELGEDGTADDIRLFRQDGPSKSPLATGIAGFVAGDPVQVQLRVKRSAAGLWSIEAAQPNGAFELQGSSTDATYAGGANLFFGVFCQYTATRKDKFFFDNLSILADAPDTKPPVLVSAQALDANTVLAVFDETLDSASALSPANYNISGVGEPTLVAFAPGSRQALHLGLSSGLQTGQYTLKTSLVADTLGNESALQTVDFEFIKIENATEFDILINEIMADPSPTRGLPEVEWVEVYNRSTKIINLQTLYLSDGGPAAALPAVLLYPDSVLVLSTLAGTAALLPITNRVKTMAGFPSLNNDTDVLTLSDAGGQVIDQVAYSINWHATAAKQDGGWTLERINPGLPCLGAENWQSCPVLPGGTPGQKNASLQNTLDTDAPYLLSAYPENANSVVVVFSEGLDKNTAANAAAFQFQPARAIASAVPTALDRRAVRLSLSEPLESGVLYTLRTAASVLDCSGNPAVASDSVQLGLPEVPEPQDIVINELLFNPATGGSDFVELYNRSNKIFNGQGFFLANFAGAAAPVSLAANRLFLPGTYLVYAANPSDIASRFDQVDPNRLFSLALPSFPDDEGNVTLFYAQNGVVVTVDSFDYSNDLHNALLSTADQDGVSLERIQADRPTNDPANWTSAGKQATGGSGTPTRRNSQSSGTAPFAGDELLFLDPARLSPDDDGFEDFLDIRFRLPGAGYVAQLTIFDAGGIPVKRLVRQQLAAVEGSLRWDGDLDDGTRARPGIYILYAEIFAPDGEVRRSKKTVAVVRQF
ncbi:MAG: lamin tail domain-containing protein [Saprospiraceae bacterium]|nr:lamin tail domain-containing protein [Saprospiraceae bacterium]